MKTLEDDSTKIKVDAHRDLLITTMISAAHHLSEILERFEYAPRHQLRKLLNEILELSMHLNSNQIAAASVEDQYEAWLSNVNRIAQDQFDIERFVEFEAE